MHMFISELCKWTSIRFSYFYGRVSIIDLQQGNCGGPGWLAGGVAFEAHLPTWAAQVFGGTTVR